MVCILPKYTHPYFPQIYIQVEIYNTHSHARTHQYTHCANSCGNTISHPAKGKAELKSLPQSFKVSRYLFFSGRLTWAGHRRNTDVHLSFGWTPPEPLEVVNLLITGQIRATDLTRKTAFWKVFFSLSPFLFPSCIPNFSPDSNSQSSQKWILESPKQRRVSRYLHITHRSSCYPGSLIFHQLYTSKADVKEEGRTSFTGSQKLHQLHKIWFAGGIQDPSGNTGMLNSHGRSSWHWLLSVVGGGPTPRWFIAAGLRGFAAGVAPRAH